MKLTVDDYSVCLDFATVKHTGQKRDDGKPYITHPVAVGTKVHGYDAKCVALLHDVLEDTDATTYDIERTLGMPTHVVKAVLLLTRTPGENYLEHLKRIRRNRLACCVKIADLLHNLSDSKPGNRKDKYILALEYLKNKR